MALQLQSYLLASWTVRKRGVVIGNVIEEVDILPLQHQTRRYRVDRSISPSLIEETAGLVEKREVVEIGL